MREYPDQHFVRTLAAVCRHGAAFGYRGHRDGRKFSRNIRATSDEHAATAADIANSLRLGELQLVADLPVDLQGRVFFSPIGSVPKSGGGCRTIHHLSYPDHSSINDGISPSDATLTCPSIEGLLGRLRLLGRGSFVWKMDLKRAFRHIVVCAEDTLLLGFMFDGVGYLDLRLPFGSRSSPFIDRKSVV